MNPPTITPDQVNNSINLWLPVILALVTAMGVVWAKVQAVIAQVSKHADQIHNLALNAPASPVPAPAPTTPAAMAKATTPAAFSFAGVLCWLAGACLVIGFALLLTGCQQSTQTPYYVSGITGNASIDASKDGGFDGAGGTVGVQFSPNPYYPLPKASGLAK